jgi:hypothetical protein
MNNRNLRTNESFASGFGLEDAYEELVLNESKKPSKDSIHYHEHKICLDTVKNPNKARFMGGVGYKEAVETLKNKFGYTDEEIGKLSGEEINESQVSGFRFIYRDKEGNRQTEIFWNDKQDLNWIRAERELFRKYPDAEIIGKTIAYKGENKTNNFIPVKTPADLKYNVELTGSHFFERPTMKFFGDRMSNYGVRFLKDENVYELYRRNPVKHGLNSSAYFDADTFERKNNIGNSVNESFNFSGDDIGDLKQFIRDKGIVGEYITVIEDNGFGKHKNTISMKEIKDTYPSFRYIHGNRDGKGEIVILIKDIKKII